MIHLNGARLGVPSSARDETKAIGRGVIPLINNRYRSLSNHWNQSSHCEITKINSPGFRLRRINSSESSLFSILLPTLCQIRLTAYNGLERRFGGECVCERGRIVKGRSGRHGSREIVKTPGTGYKAPKLTMDVQTQHSSDHQSTPKILAGIPVFFVRGSDDVAQDQRRPREGDRPDGDERTWTINWDASQSRGGKGTLTRFGSGIQKKKRRDPRSINKC